MQKILETGCLLTLLLAAGPALAQETNTPASETLDDSIDDTAEEAIEVAEDEVEEEKFPVGGSLTLGFAFSQSSITAALQDEATDPDFYELSNVDGSSKYDGTQGSKFLALELGLSYAALDVLSFSAAIAASKSVDDGYLDGSDGSSLAQHETNLSDTTLGARWSMWTVPVAEINLSLSGHVKLPTGKGSLTRGLITGTRLTLGASRKLGPVNIALSGGATYNFWENPTQRYEERFGELREVSGDDLGRPLPLLRWVTGASVQYSIIEPLSLSASYQLSNVVSAYEGPDDEMTSEYAQTGTQLGPGAHAFSLSLGYTLPFESGTSISLSMSTRNRLYSADNKRITNPFFDTESVQGAYTGYAISLSQAL